MFALPICKPRFQSIVFYQNSPKIKLFFQKEAKFLGAGGLATPNGLRRLGPPLPHPQNSLTIGVARGTHGARPPSPNRNDKTVTEKGGLSSVSLSFLLLTLFF